MKEKPKTSFKSSLHGTFLPVFLINVKNTAKAKWKVQWDRLHQVSKIRQTRKTRKRKNQRTSQRFFSIAKLLKSRRNTVMSQYLLVRAHTMRYPSNPLIARGLGFIVFLYWLPLMAPSTHGGLRNFPARSSDFPTYLIFLTFLYSRSCTSFFLFLCRYFSCVMCIHSCDPLRNPDGAAHSQWLWRHLP